MAERLESTLKVNLNESCRCTELEKELEATKIKLAIKEKEVAKLERQIAITDGYNEDLRRQVDVLSSQLHAFKSSVHSSRTVCDASTECEEQQQGEVQPTDEIVLNPATLMKSTSAADQSFVFSPPPSFHDPLTALQNSQTPVESVQLMMDEIRETCESAVAESAFMYDPETGLYYDSLSGYYYDAEKSLYYDVYSGCYYYYDSSTQSYQFHSQVDYARYSTLSHVILNRTNNAAGGQMAAGVEPSVQGKKKKPKSVRKQERERCIQRIRSNETNHTADDATDEKLPQQSNLRKRLKRHKQNKRNVSRANDLIPSRLVGHCAELIKKTVFSQSAKLLSSFRINEKESTNEAPPLIHGIDATSCKTMLPPVGTEDIGSAGESCSDSMTSEDCSSVELEEGELSSSSLSSDSENYESCREESGASLIPIQPEFLRCTPCIRVIVKRSDFLPFGNLYIVTCTSVATIGREESLKHAILIPDPAVSKMHCDIKYNEELQRYVIQDHASQCGTYVNGKRLSEAKVISEACPLYNGDTLQIGETLLDLHIHQGHDTCMNCEPGNLLVLAPSTQKVENVVIVSKEEKEQQRRQQVKAMKKKYGLQKMDFEVNEEPLDRTRYEDRAADRRTKQGSDNPHQRDDLPASVNRPIDCENVGHKLLAKLGWKEGESIGKSQEGIKEPIQASLRYDRSAGLGSEGNLASTDDVVHVHVSNKWVKAQHRYNKITTTKADESIDDDTNNRNSTAEDDESKSGAGDTVSTKVDTVYKRQWVRGKNMEPSVT